MILNVNGTECEIIGYDTYINRFEGEVKPEYKGEAEACLLEALEREDYLCNQYEIVVYVDSEKLRIGSSREFVFKNCMPEESALPERMGFAVFEYRYMSN